MTSTTLQIFINSAPTKVYDFVSNLAGFPKWAETFCHSIKQVNGEWIAQTPQGPAAVRMSPKNGAGVKDHYVKISSSFKVFVLLRVLPKNDGSEVSFTLLETAEMTEEQSAKDIGFVKQDLDSLKRVLEK